MTEPVITMTVKEAEAMEAEMAALVEANTKLTADLATAKTAGEKVAATEKLAEDLTEVMAASKLIGADKVAETKARLLQPGGPALYFKKACALYLQAEAGRKEALARLQEVPARLGKPAEDGTKKKASETPPNALEAAKERFAARVMSAR